MGQEAETNKVAVASLIFGLGSFCTLVVSAGILIFSCYDSIWTANLIPIIACFCLAIISFILGIVALMDKRRKRIRLAFVGIIFGAISSIFQILAWVFGGGFCF